MVREYCIALFATLAASSAHAATVKLVGLFGQQTAVLVVGDATPIVLRVGHSAAGIEVLRIHGGRVTLRVDGRRRVIRYGNVSYAMPSTRTRQTATLTANARGRFMADGVVDGAEVRFLVDTGATTVAFPGAVAYRLGIDYRRGRRGMTQTANGPAPAWRINLDSVKIGTIKLHDVAAIVIAHGLNVALLGMSFLDRVAMRRDAMTMVLTRRF